MIDTGSTGFMLVCAMLVLLMTPGLAFFYGGLSRRKNVVNTMVMVFGVLGIVGVMWVVCGWSFAYGGDGSLPFFGGLDQIGCLSAVNDMVAEAEGTPDAFAVLSGQGALANDPELAAGYPAIIDIVFQMAFAMITCAIITGAVAGRMKFGAVCAFVAVWVVVVYAPLAHMVWGGDGSLIGDMIGALDFAGGDVVHISSGLTGLILCLMLGRRKGFAVLSYRPHNVPFVALGAALLWFGWFGFNAGSAFAANGTAGYAWMSTTAATAAAMLAWGFTERIRTGHYTAIGAASGIVAGLVAITPAADVVSPLWAMVIGAIAGVLCCFACGLKFKLGYDDSLDVVGVHGVGGLTGTVLIGFFGEGTGLLAGGDWRQLAVQVIIALCAMLYSGVVTAIIAFALEKTIGWRVTEAQEVGGIDLADQGERAYDFAGTASSVLKEVR